MLKKLPVILLSLLFSSHSYALSNENFKVTQVDVTKTLGIIWLDISSQSLSEQPVCNNRKYGAATCEISEDFCKSMISIALTAKTTGGVVDFQYDGQCLGSFSTVNRFRLSH
jgi:hypothetical protein